MLLLSSFGDEVDENIPSACAFELRHAKVNPLKRKVTQHISHIAAVDISADAAVALWRGCVSFRFWPTE